MSIDRTSNPISQYYLLGLLVASTALCSPALVYAQTQAISNPATTALNEPVSTNNLRLRPGMLEQIEPATTTSFTNESDEELLNSYVETDNTTEPTIDGSLETRPLDQLEAPGIRVGTFTLRPSISQGLNFERQSDTAVTTRVYSTTGIRGSLNSDWSRHALIIDGEGVYERNLNGNSNGEEPTVNLKSDLRLDLAEEMQANIRLGYDYSKEDTNDPNAISNARNQGGEHIFSAGASIQRTAKLRTLAALDVSRIVYTDATSSTGSAISLRDRDRWNTTVRGRIGYEISPSLIPFLEAALGTSRYDKNSNANSYDRSSLTISAKVGSEFDLGEKLRGEFGIGLANRNYSDDRLKSLTALIVDSNVYWSPQRGTDISFGLRSTIEDFASGDQGGFTTYELSTGIAHQVRSNVVAELNGLIEYRNLDSSAERNTTDYTLGTGLTWSLNRYIDVNGRISYKFTPASDRDDFKIGAGIVLKR